MTLFETWLILQLPTIIVGIKFLVGGTSILAFIWLVTVYILSLVDPDDMSTMRQLKPMTRIVSVLLPLWLLFALVPDKSTMLTMLGLHVISSNEKVMVLPDKILTLANQELNKLIKQTEINK